uniref:Potassium channel domain-containing protein n=1 Tax=Romanomermis culicivorax TaxID=13658 RepID=A0A915I9F4_ROMCU
WHDTDPPNVEVGKFQNYLNTLWLIAVTSLTIGYGDLVPNTMRRVKAEQRKLAENCNTLSDIAKIILKDAVK